MHTGSSWISKRCRIVIEVFLEILQICPTLSNQDFVKPPSEDEMVSFIKDLGYTGKCDMLSEIHTNHSPGEHLLLSSISASLGSPQVFSSETLLVYLCRRRKHHLKLIEAGKGMDLLFDVALLEATQLKKSLKKSKQETQKLHASGLGDGVGVPDVPKYQYESKNESWEDSEDDNNTDDDNDDDDDVVDSDADGDNEASDSERTDSDEDENPNLNQNDDEQEEYKEEYVRTPDNYEFSDDDEEYEELYKDVNMRLKDVEHEEERKGDAEMTDAGRDDVSQEKSYEQVEDDSHVTLTAAHKTEGLMQSSYVSSDVANQFLNLDNVPPGDNKVVSMMNVKSTPTQTPAPTTKTTITLIPALLDFSSLFGFDQRVYVLEKELSQLKQVDYSAQLLETIKSQIPAMVDAQLSTRLKDSIQKAFRSYTAEFEKKAQGEKKRYIDLIEKSTKYIIKDEVKSQLPQILPKEVSDYATSVIQSTITESLENILLDKMQKSKSYRGAQEHKELYDGLVKSYKLDKNLFESYGKAYSLKRDREDKDKDEDPPAGLDQRLKIRKTNKDAEPSKGSKSKESKSSSSKGTKSQPKSSGKYAQVEESLFETADTKMPQNQGSDLGNTDDQPNVEATSECDWFKKPERPPNPDSDWNARKSVDFRPPQTWISRIAQAEKPPFTFDELMSTPIDFSAYVINNLKIDNLTQEHLVRPTFNLLKGTCKSRVELEYHFEEYRGRQVVLVGYFINNDLEYMKGGSSSRKYTTSTTKTKAAKYDDIQGIEDMIPSLWSPVKWYDYGYLEEIEVRREDQKLYKFKEGDFPRLNLCDIEDMLFLLVQKKISNLERDVIFNLKVALQMFIRRVVILKRVEDLQLGVESYQKKLNITKPKTFRLIRSDELYKFSGGTLTSVRSILYDIASNLRMDYLPKRRWSNLDKQRSRIMIKAIDKLQLERRLMRSLEKFVGGREYGEDFRLLERTI
ncbi:hypothetical protein Tco_0974326 [Tanacetum coccineum]|uniref:Uncharacterized protein n=1 Tax=Tanacetum coccineum TaxID=301880 RepID=A0ABQ5EB89_9ASTR